jgi:heme oxygenase
MVIKNLITEKHKEAENTLFFKKLISKKITKEIWANFLFNKMLFYNEIEHKLNLEIFKDLIRTEKLKKDFLNLKVETFSIKNSVFEYIDYLNKINEKELMAHVYVWYMGDLNGGNVINKIIDFESSSLVFENSEYLKQKILDYIDISMLEEINNSFDWAIKILNDFEKDLLEESN